MFLTIIIFIIILGLLVFVHEFGHFIVAKKSGMKVDEFGFGFPPRIAGVQKVQGKWKWVWGFKAPQDSEQTVYSINWIPLGGFVKIVGENNEAQEDPRSFINQPFWPRLATLVAGVVMNVILAWVLLTIGYAVGLPVGVDNPNNIPKGAILSDAHIGILSVTSGLPADKAGIKPDDLILSIDGQDFSTITDVQNYVASHAGHAVNFEILRGKQDLHFSLTPNLKPAPDQGPTGIELSFVGKLRFPWYKAPWEGIKTTSIALQNIVWGLGQLFTGKVGFSSLGGPVEIAKQVGRARQTGVSSLLSLTVLLSLSLAVLNILPIPALDGGRVLFLLIEKIRRKRNNQKVEQYFNTIGFVLLILLMIAVTINDIIRK